MGNKTTVGSVFGKEHDVRTYKEDFSWVLPSTMIGVEIELERVHPTLINLISETPLWRVVQDGSLRNVDGLDPCEFVFSSPLCGYDLKKALDHFDKVIAGLPKRKIVEPLCSARTSVHVHLDMRDVQLSKLFEFVVKYTVFEKALFNFAGKDRENNVFCLPFYKATGSVFSMLTKEGVEEGGLLYAAVSQNDRYNALNLCSLKKFGTVEFRHLAGTISVERISTWINILMCLKKHVLEGPEINIFEFPKEFSSIGPEKFGKKVFGDFYDILKYPTIYTDLLEGVRIAQDLIHTERVEIPLDHTNPHPEEFKKFVKSVGGKLPPIRKHKQEKEVKTHKSNKSNTSFTLNTGINPIPFNTQTVIDDFHDDDL